MARTRHEYIKVEQRLFQDHRYFMLTEFGQLLYINLISLSKQTKNRIPKNLGVIKEYMRSKRPLNDFELTIIEIKNSFPNFKGNKHFYYFEEFEERYNYGTLNIQNQGVEEEKEKEEEKEEEQNRTPKPAHLSNEDFITTLKANKAYAHIDIDRELGKMDAWLSTNNRKKTRKFVVNWLNKIDKPLEKQNSGYRIV